MSVFRAWPSTFGVWLSTVKLRLSICGVWLSTFGIGLASSRLRLLPPDGFQFVIFMSFLVRLKKERDKREGERGRERQRERERLAPESKSKGKETGKEKEKVSCGFIVFRRLQARSGGFKRVPAAVCSVLFCLQSAGKVLQSAGEVLQSAGKVLQSAGNELQSAGRFFVCICMPSTLSKLVLMYLGACSQRPPDLKKMVRNT